MFIKVTLYHRVYSGGDGDRWEADGKLLINIDHIVTVRHGKVYASIETITEKCYTVLMEEVAPLEIVSGGVKWE